MFNIGQRTAVVGAFKLAGYDVRCGCIWAARGAGLICAERL
jgi:hypothetical protein